MIKKIYNKAVFAYDVIKDATVLFRTMAYAKKVQAALKIDPDILQTYHAYRQGVEATVQEKLRGTVLIVMPNREVNVVGMSITMQTSLHGYLHFHDLDGKPITNQEFKVVQIGAEPVKIAIKRVLSTYVGKTYVEQHGAFCFDFTWNF